MTTEKFELWCLVELFGHNKIAGLVTEQTIGGSSFIRVDVPAIAETQSFTRFFNGSAIYAINPMSEEAAIAIAERLRTKPIDIWDMGDIIRKAVAEKMNQLPQSLDSTNEDVDDELPI
jgi:hypothetical protein